MQVFVRIRGQKHGPFDASQIENMILRRQLNRRSDISEDGESWFMASRHPDFLPIFDSLPRHDPAPSSSNEPDFGTTIDLSNGWYYQSKDGDAAGPVDEDTVHNLLQLSIITSTTQVWHESWSSWMKAGNSAEFLSKFKPPPSPESINRVRHESSPSRTVFIVTAIFAAMFMIAGIIALIISKS